MALGKLIISLNIMSFIALSTAQYMPCSNGPQNTNFNCSCSTSDIKCFCTNNQATNLTYDYLHNHEISAGRYSHFHLENCTGEVVISDGFLDYFTDVMHLSFTNIKKLSILKGELEQGFPGSDIKFERIESLDLHPQSIALSNDGKAKVTLVNTFVSLNTSDEPEQKVNQATFKCSSGQTIEIGRRSDVLNLMKKALNCCEYYEKSCPKAPSSSLIKKPSFTLMILMTLVSPICMYLSLL